jgi:hypothetical protein
MNYINIHMHLFLDVDDYTGSLQFLVRGQMGQNLKAKKRGEVTAEFRIQIHSIRIRIWIWIQADPNSLTSDLDMDPYPGTLRNSAMPGPI